MGLESHMPGIAGAGGPPQPPTGCSHWGYGEEDGESHQWSCRRKEGHSHPEMSSASLDKRR